MFEEPSETFLLLVTLFVLCAVSYSWFDYKWKQWQWERNKTKQRKAVEAYQSRKKS